MYFGKHTQTGETTDKFIVAGHALEMAEDYHWEPVEVILMETVRRGVHGLEVVEAEFPCHYYGDYTCELTANRPDSLCPFHAGEED